MKGTVNYELRGDIAILEVDNPPVNPLSSGVRVVFVINLIKLIVMKMLEVLS